MRKELEGWVIGSKTSLNERVGHAADAVVGWQGGPANSMFGTIGNKMMPFSPNADFIPVDDNSHVVNIRNTNVDAQWLGLDTVNMQHHAYVYCSPLASVIDKLAEADTNGAIQIVKTDETPYDNYRKNPRLKRIIDLFNKPNPLQTFEDWNSEQIVLCKKYGYCPVFAVSPDGFDKSYTLAMFNLDPFYWRPVYSYEYSLYDPQIQPIVGWKATFGGKDEFISSKDVILIKDGFVQQTTDRGGLPLSKIAGLDFFISNICAAMEADNVLLKKKGPLGIFSHDPRPDPAGWQPMTNDEKTEVQNELKQYGLTLGQIQYIISRTPIKWNAMSFNVRDLMTKETIRQAIDGICDRFGFPAELMSGKNATYENRSSAEKFLYQNNIIPFAYRRMARYSQFFSLEDYDAKIILNYSHLPVLQEDTEKEARSKKADTEAATLQWKDGLITFNEYREKIGQEPVAGMDKVFYPEWAKLNGLNLSNNGNQSNSGANSTTEAQGSAD